MRTLDDLTQYILEYLYSHPIKSPVFAIGLFVILSLTNYYAAFLFSAAN